ncbi:MAG: HAMP domain-containing histidine kinase, partial [Anaerolineales bacterium]|nr:HAMP domain-containing histidine kinase [Anaerolineales bacterium]
NGQHLLKLINDILDVAKIQSGRVDLNYTTVDVAKLCRSMLTLVDPLAQSKQIQIEFCLDGTVQFIEADEKRLKQILINLLTNAIKFTHDQGRVGLDVQAKGDTIVFSVWDTGIGIAPDDINKLFEPFVQLDNSITRKYEGTGLGLTLVQQFTDMMKGTLSVETEPDKGSQFMVALPQTQPDSYHPVVDQAI